MADGGGLYLLVRPNGSRLWRLKYRFANREKKLSFGVYPAVSLAAAARAGDKQLGRQPLDIGRSTIYREMRRMGIERPC